jgi:hypothetical protein
LKYALLACATALAFTKAAYAQEPVAAVYLCTVAEKAGIQSSHREGAPPPSAFAIDGPPTRFKMRIAPHRDGAEKYRLVELAYDGADRDPAEWDDENSVLHGEHVGDGGDFPAVEGQAFFTLKRTIHRNSDGDIAFYHAGFEAAGGEDTYLSVRWGRCRKTE